MKKSNLHPYKLLIPVVALVLFFIPECSIASDRPFNNTSNWGGTGLMEIPNARILEDGVVRIEVTQALPYRWYSGGMGILPGLEFSGRVTQITNIKTSGLMWGGYGDYKDKAFDLKYQFLPESKILPAIAFGLNDFWGTRLFPSEYMVMSRQVYPLDITLGVGRGRLGGNPISSSYDLFGGFEMVLSDRFMFMAEYSPIKYENDKSNVKGVPDGAETPVNIGIRAKITRGIDMGVSFQRGEVLGISLSVTSLLGAQILPQAPDPAPLLPIDRRSFNERDQKEIIRSIYDAVKKAGFMAVAVYTDGKKIICEFQNNKYLSNRKAVDRVLRLLLFYSPGDADLLTAIVMNETFPILKVSVDPDHMDKYILGDIPEETFVNSLLNIEIADKSFIEEYSNYLKIADDNGYNFEYDIKPDLDIYWNDPSGFMKFAVGIAPYFSMDLWEGASAYVRFNAPLYSNISSPSSEDLPPDVVSSDISKYKKDNYTFDRLQIDQIFRLTDRFFSRASIGYFETMYAGIGGEALYFIGDGKIALGFEGDWGKKRYPKKLFKLMDVDRHTILGSVYYYYPNMEITFKTQYGRFLAGDAGWKIDINRRYKTGAVLGVFLTYTDTDNINQPDFNDNYNNKGFYLSLPIRMFYTKDSTKALHYNISPWTRDVGQTIPHLKDLYNIAGDLMPAKFKAETDDLKN